MPAVDQTINFVRSSRGIKVVVQLVVMRRLCHCFLRFRLQDLVPFVVLVVSGLVPLLQRGLLLFHGNLDFWVPPPYLLVNKALSWLALPQDAGCCFSDLVGYIVPGGLHWLVWVNVKSGCTQRHREVPLAFGRTPPLDLLIGAGSRLSPLANVEPEVYDEEPMLGPRQSKLLKMFSPDNELQYLINKTVSE